MISGELPPLAVVTAPAGAGKTHAVRGALSDSPTLWVTMRDHHHAVDLDEVERLDGHPGPQRLIEGLLRRTRPATTAQRRELGR